MLLTANVSKRSLASSSTMQAPLIQLCWWPLALLPLSRPTALKPPYRPSLTCQLLCHPSRCCNQFSCQQWSFGQTALPLTLQPPKSICALLALPELLAHTPPNATDTAPPSNGLVHVLCQIMCQVVSSTTEAELGALFLNAHIICPISPGGIAPPTTSHTFSNQ